MTDNNNELVFCALGGLGEIGMNAALYGFGPPHRRKWLMVDCGVSFAGPDLPGIDLVVPNLSFIEKMKKDLVGLVITHAHEDHIGAVVDLYPRLGCRLFATPFAASLLEVKRLAEPGAPKISIEVVPVGGRIDLAPFDVELIPMAHSIPESMGLAIRTPLGTVVHSGDWKIDHRPVVGTPTDQAKLTALGDEGVLALVCDSTNILREGVSPSETDVAGTLLNLISSAPARVLVTTFASNIARIRAVADAALATGRSVVVVGRAMDRAIQVARECGYLDGIPPFFGPDSFSYFARDKTVVVATGSQGEVRAALAKLARDDHPDIKLAPGDRVIFSSRTIPGNEREVSRVVNGLVLQGLDIVTDRTELVHVSGHPRRAEVAELYGWVRPRIAIPAHGEPLHLAEHAKFARALGVPEVITARDGDVVLLAPGKAAIIDEAPHGRLVKDGNQLIDANDPAVQARGRLSFAGIISIAIALTSRGDIAGDPDVLFSGVPAQMRDGKGIDAVIDAAIFETLDNLGRGKRRDADAAASAIERSVRGAVGAAWGKKPIVHVLVVEV